jgi:hypothetical protein
MSVISFDLIGHHCANESVFRVIAHFKYTATKGFEMTRREQWRRVLDIEVQRWSAMTPEQLASALDKEQVYEVELDSKTYQVEVEMLKSTEECFHVMVAVDDGSQPASIVPETQIFICNKKFRTRDANTLLSTTRQPPTEALGSRITPRSSSAASQHLLRGLLFALRP